MTSLNEWTANYLNQQRYAKQDNRFPKCVQGLIPPTQDRGKLEGAGGTKLTLRGQPVSRVLGSAQGNYKSP